MSSGYFLERRDGYLYVHLEADFEMTADNTAGVWTAICETCRERGLRRALAVGEGVTRRSNGSGPVPAHWTRISASCAESSELSLTGTSSRS